MQRAKLAWPPVLVALVLGLVPWSGAVMGQDGFAFRALNVVIVVSLLAPAPGWALLRRPLPFLLLLAAKLAVFFALAPRGLATLGMSYTKAPRSAELVDAWFLYFWGMPLCLMLIGAVESWLLSLALRGVPLKDTPAWRHRRMMAVTAAAGVACAVGWWLLRGDYYLWRLRQGSAAARSSLARVGPRVLPSLYRELEAGQDRDVLVGVIVDIRHRVVARKIGSALFSDTEAAQVAPDPAMVAALSRALSSAEPELAEAMVRRIERADFDTVVAVFCDGFPRAPAPVQTVMVPLAVSAGRLAWRSYEAPRDAPGYHHVDDSGRVEKGDVAAAQSEMRAKLGCALPLVEQALVREAPSWPEDGAPLWSMNAIGLLAEASPLPKDARARLLAVAPRVKDSYVLDQMLSRLNLLGESPPASTASLLEIFRRSESESVRSKIIDWARGSPKRVVLRSFWCGVFPLASNQQRHSLMYLLDSAPGPAEPCVASTVMNAYEKAVLSPRASPPLWLVPAGKYLRTTDDARIAPWAAALAKRADKNQLFLLRDL